MAQGKEKTLLATQVPDLLEEGSRHPVDAKAV